MEGRLEQSKEHERAALEKQRISLVGTSEERLEHERQQQQAERIDGLHRQAARRLANQSLIRGWTAWREQWYEQAREKRLMLAAMARLGKPLLVAALAWMKLLAAASKRQKLVGAWQHKLEMVQTAGEQLLKHERRTAAEQRLELLQTIRDLERQLKELGREVGRRPLRHECRPLRHE